MCWLIPTVTPVEHRFDLPHFRPSCQLQALKKLRPEGKVIITENDTKTLAKARLLAEKVWNEHA